ncbi:MAG: protein translocase subunit SecD [Phycisphaeraceae bacterium]|nr:protein translocase subunit SecD [Phycisphaerales bacterium]MCB9861365.1 protein translocase subunit SecD [Phycisphaeraceae bacterium]
MLKHSGRLLAISVVLIAVLFWLAVFPPAEKLRFGKDLRGGVSVTYGVRIDPGEDPSVVIPAMIEVLKSRIDPNGQLDITMVRQGNDRLEITMPAPSEKILLQRRDVNATIDSIEQSALTDAIIDQVLAADAEGRLTVIESSVSNTQLQDLLKAVSTASDAAVAAMNEYQQGVEAGEPDAKLDELAAVASKTAIAYDDARATAQAQTITADQIRTALRTNNQVSRKYDRDQKQVIELKSERDRAFETLQEQYPDRVDDIKRIRAAYEDYEKNRKTLDDPDDLIRMLRGAGVLSFRITVDPGELPNEAEIREQLHESGPQFANTRDAGWYKINRIENWFDSLSESENLRADPASFFRSRPPGFVVEEYRGAYYMLCWDVRGKRLTKNEGTWKVASAFRGIDEIQRPAINFTMNPSGASLLGKLTGANIGKPMAVILDDEVITAPTLNGNITSSGQISGDFPVDELNYIIRTLNAGSLQAKLSPQPISVNEIGPDLGQDNLDRGIEAGLISIAIVAVFMLVYYFPTCGGVAVVSLVFTAAMILIWMALNQWTFTMPGIAGIVLTFGMAVDANVLIYERMREELNGGADVRDAIRLGYSKALSSIVDGNVTNLIVCLVLLLPNVATPEVRGFALTLGTGVVMTMIAALFLGRIMFGTLFQVFGWKRISMLPMSVPAIDRLLTPRVNWIKMKWVFLPISLTYVAIGLVMVFGQNVKMLDIDFRSGTQVTLQMKQEQPESEQRVMLTRQEVEDRVHEIGNTAENESAVKALRTAEIMPLNPQNDGITSDTFIIKTFATDKDAVVNSLVETFADVLDSRQPLSADGLDTDENTPIPVYPVNKPRLGANFDKPEFLQDVRDWLGGAVIVLNNLDPAPTKVDLETRLGEMREQQDFSDISGRKWEVRVLSGSDDAVTSAVILVHDSAINNHENPDGWTTQVAGREWELVTEALQRPAQVAGVQSFSPAVARTFAAQAIIAIILSLLMITIYIWVRFGNMRYSIAAVACLFHDVLTVVGLVALAEILCDTPGVQRFAQAIGLQPFKINLDMVAAILTIIGYSLNDTIIVMDRIRENKGKRPVATVPIVNLSVNQTISRTIITSGTTLLAVIILYLFGGAGIRGFAFALLVGVAVGTYSSIAVAAQLVVGSRGSKDEPEVPATPTSQMIEAEPS